MALIFMLQYGYQECKRIESGLSTCTFNRGSNLLLPIQKSFSSTTVLVAPSGC